MHRIMGKVARVSSPMVVAIALLALTAPALMATTDCTIKCEKCTCNMNTGICECTNCTLTGCTTH